MKKRIILLAILALLPRWAQAQQVRISVMLGQENAEYAYVKAANRYVGQCNAQGLCTLDASALHPGDTLRAEYSGLRSSTAVYRRGTTEYSLMLGSRELNASSTQGRAVRLMREYLRVVDRLRIRDILFGQKYSLPYRADIAFSQDGRAPIHQESEFRLALVHGHDVFDADDFWDTFGLQVDSLTAAEVATALLYARELLGYVHYEEGLLEDAENRNILIHKVISDEDELCYILIEGQNRNNQTVVHLDRQGRHINRISRAFVGSGTVVNAPADSYHEMEVIMTDTDRRARVGGINLDIHSPGSEQLHTHVRISGVEPLRMQTEEFERIQPKLGFRPIFQRGFFQQQW